MNCYSKYRKSLCFKNSKLKYSHSLYISDYYNIYDDIYKYNDSNEPNTVRALEITNEVKKGLYKCNIVKFRYIYSKEYGRRVEFLKS